MALNILRNGINYFLLKNIRIARVILLAELFNASIHAAKDSVAAALTAPSEIISQYVLALVVTSGTHSPLAENSLNVSPKLAYC